MRNHLLAILLLFSSSVTILAQKHHPLSLGVELSTHHVWRGIEYGNAPVVFPQINFNKQKWNAYLLGGYALNGSHTEVDMGVSFTQKNLTLGLNDYYFVTPSGEKDKYFNFRNHSTGHYVEAYAAYDLPFAPLRMMASSYLFGPDRLMNGNRAYSSYAEICYTHSFTPTEQLSLTMGASLNKGFYTNYQHGFSVVNVTLKYATTLNLGKFRLPASASFILNPTTEKSHFSLSLYWNSL